MPTDTQNNTAILTDKAAQRASSRGLDAILPRLRGVRETATGYVARCPAHDDSNASLSINKGNDGRVLLHCHAGCAFAAVAAAAGVTAADLAPPRPEVRPKARIVETYDYTDAAGNLVFQVVRMDPKSFRQRRPDGHGGWLWNMRDITRVLYRLPQIAAAIAAGRTVLVVEGEKDVATSERLGRAATCNAGGAGKWHRDYTAALGGADVVIIPDADRPGQDHAARVAGALQGHAARVRILPLPAERNGRRIKDLTDYVEAGGTARELASLIDASADCAPAAAVIPAPTAAVATPPAGTVPSFTQAPGNIVILPGNGVTISTCASDVFARFEKRDTLFVRGTGLYEVVRHPTGAFQLEQMTPEGFRSRLEKLGPVMAWRAGRDRDLQLKNVVCPEETAKALLATAEARELLAPISAVVAAPVIVEQDGRLRVLGQGYSRAGGGLFVTQGAAPPDVELAEAVDALKLLLVDFAFQAPGDHARALAAMITPALRLGGLLPYDVPVDIAEAKESQSGKTYRQRLVRTLYGEWSIAGIARRRNGVGSLDEDISKALIGGRPFLPLDNVRELLASELLESVVRGTGAVSARALRTSLDVDVSRVMVQVTSNGAETTVDLANRSAICRIFKAPQGHEFHPWPEGDLLAHVRANHLRYLGCVFAVVRAWHSAGKPRTADRRHDMREWAGTLDWICQEVMGTGPLLDDHRALQQRVSNPQLVWLRAMAIAAERDGKLGQELNASAIWEICSDGDVAIPGLRYDDEVNGRQQVGKVLGKLYRAANGGALVVDDYVVNRTTRVEHDDRGRPRDSKYHTVTRQVAGGSPVTPQSPLTSGRDTETCRFSGTTEGYRGLGGMVGDRHPSLLSTPSRLPLRPPSTPPPNPSPRPSKRSSDNDDDDPNRVRPRRRGHRPVTDAGQEDPCQRSPHRCHPADDPRQP